MDYIYTNKNNESLILDFPIGKAPEETKVDGEVFIRDFGAELQGKSFCLKGSGWPGLDSKKKRQMTTKNENAGKRTKDTWGDAPQLVPNYKGKKCESWEDASSLASKDKE